MQVKEMRIKLNDLRQTMASDGPRRWQQRCDEGRRLEFVEKMEVGRWESEVQVKRCLR